MLKVNNTRTVTDRKIRFRISLEIYLSLGILICYLLVQYAAPVAPIVSKLGSQSRHDPTPAVLLYVSTGQAVHRPAESPAEPIPHNTVNNKTLFR